MKNPKLVLDTEACIFGWGPCPEAYGFSHACRRPAHHPGDHYCATCGARAKEPVKEPVKK
jgi:hypothetical protein